MAEDKSEKLRIRLHVYDTDIPVNVRPEDEPLYEEKRPKKKKSGKDQKNKQDDELDIIDFNDL